MPLSRTYALSLLLAVQVVVILGNFFFIGVPLSYTKYYWYCDTAPIILAALLYFKNYSALKGFLNIILFGQLGYMVVIGTKYLFGVTLAHFVFEHSLTSLYTLTTLIVHTSALIALLATYHLITSHRSLLYSLFILIITFIVITLFVTPDSSDATNYNLIFHSHLLSWLPHYTQAWVVLAFVFVVLPTHLFQMALSSWALRSRTPHS